MESLDYWRLCDELSIDEAAHLLIGTDPNEVEAQAAACREMLPNTQARYVMDLGAAIQAISVALRRGVINGKMVTDHVPFDDDDHIPVDAILDIYKSRVEVESLRNWLTSRGITTGFFFPAGTDAPDYLDPNNPRYAPKLAAAVRAWQSVADTGGKTAKQALDKWLEGNAALFGLTKDDGSLNRQGIEDVAKVANWQLSGGAPKTPGK